MKFKPFISIKTLEDLGFLYIDQIYISILFHKGSFYVQSNKDGIIAKFEGKKATKVYKPTQGQGPAEFGAPGKLFIYSPDTLAIFDALRRSLMLYDLDLNLKSEKRIPLTVYEVKNTSDGSFLARGIFGYSHHIARLDKNFNVIETFFKINFDKIKKRLHESILIIDENTISYFPNVQLERDCKIEIYDVSQKKFILSLKWRQPHPLPGRNKSRIIENRYYTGTPKDYGDYFVVQSLFLTDFSSRTGKPDFLVFSKKGELVLQINDFPYYMISTNHKNQIFVFVEDEGYYTASLEDILK